MKILIAIILILTQASCESESPIGGPCDYNEIPGIARIVSVTEVEGTTYCDVPVEVLFDFIPDEPIAYELKYLSVWPIENVRLLIGDGKNPPKRWIEAIGIEPGSEHNCSRFQIYNGACPGAYYDFIDVNEASVGDSCDAWNDTGNYN